MNVQKTCDDFLHKYGMHHDTINMEQCIERFATEMQDGLCGNGSLMMIPTYIALDGSVPFDQPIIVIDAGGTNFRVAVVTFLKDKPPLIESYEKYEMPGTKGTITSEEFFRIIATRLLPVLDRSDRVGFCFSYASEIMPNKDSMFIEFSKEISVTGMQGRMLGEGINKELKAMNKSEKQFLVLNDTVASMLSAVANSSHQDNDGYIGLILGTGVNSCYGQQCCGITKLKGKIQDTGSMAINIETGGYAKFPRGQIDEAYDASTQNPGHHIFEKMVAGAYQGGVLYLTIMQGIKDGLFTESFTSGFGAFRELIPLWEVDAFCDCPKGDNPLAKITIDNESDRELLLSIFTASYERAAKMIIVNLAAIMKITQTGSDPKRPVCVAAEGTTFHKSRLFRQLLDHHVKAYLVEQKGMHCSFIKVENATLIGSAVAGLIG